jgi:probable O-glycosylation ligase (exosortase A-associated)
MRDVLISLVILALLPVSFRRPFVGLCVFSWLAYMRVQDLAWDWARDVRWSYYVAILTCAGYLMFQERGKRLFLPDARCYLMLALCLLLGLGVLFSQHPDARQVARYLEFVKIVAVALLTTALVTDRERLRVLVWVIALSLGFYGVKSGLWGIATLGRGVILRGPGGMLADNNDLSLALAMIVPLLFHLGWTEKRPEVRRGFWIALPLTVITIGLTHSRGGFLSVATACAVLIWRSRNRIAGLLVAGLVVAAGFALAPSSYLERLATLRHPTEEGSAAGRLRAWGIATRMAFDHPWLGVGFGKFQQHYLEYAVDPSEAELAGENIVAHSSYMQIWAEGGTPALAGYLALIVGSFWTCSRVRRMAEQRYAQSWIRNYAVMFEASLATFVVGASFLNRAHFDLFYHWVALILVFGVVARREMAQAAAPEGPPGAAARGGFARGSRGGLARGFARRAGD